MPRYFIQLAYNGTHYHGWQAQDNTPDTVQQVLLEKLTLITGKVTELVGCGRTDTGVHARDYYAHFDSEKEDLHLPDTKYIYKLNKVLPYDIAVKKIIPVHDTASSRFDAVSRTYEYLLHQFKDPFLTESSLLVYGNLNIEAMNEAAVYLLTVTDFTSFSKANTQTKTNHCQVTFAQWMKLNDTQYVFRITANRFLRNMVRAVVGTLLEVGKEKMSLQEFKQIIESKNRSEAGMSASGHALYLTHIQYPENYFHV